MQRDNQKRDSQVDEMQIAGRKLVLPQKRSQSTYTPVENKLSIFSESKQLLN